MKTIVLEKPGEFRLTETPKPEAPGPGEALVRMMRIGICGTDLHAFEGTQPFFEYPRILGHEMSGEIIALGEGAAEYGLALGDVCAIAPYLSCGKCTACRRGRTNCCRYLKILGVQTDGGMREILKVPMSKLIAVQGVPPEKLAMVEMLGIGAHAVRRAQMEDGENVLVIGAGPIGLGTMAFAKKARVNLMAMDINPDRLRFCQEKLGIEQCFNAREMTPEKLMDELGGELPTTVFDATGSRASMEAAFDYVDHSGQLIYVGLVKQEISFDDPDFHRHEMTLKSSRNATDDDLKWVVDSLADGSVNVDGWITHVVPPEQLVTDFASWLRPETGVIKAMLAF